MKKQYFEKLTSPLSYYQATANPSSKRETLKGDRKLISVL